MAESLSSKGVKGAAGEILIGQLHKQVTEGLLAECKVKVIPIWSEGKKVGTENYRDKDWFKLATAFLDKQKAVYVPIESAAMDEIDELIESRGKKFNKFNKENVQELYPTEDDIIEVG